MCHLCTAYFIREGQSLLSCPKVTSCGRCCPISMSDGFSQVRCKGAGLGRGTGSRAGSLWNVIWRRNSIPRSLLRYSRTRPPRDTFWISQRLSILMSVWSFKWGRDTWQKSWQVPCWPPAQSIWPVGANHELTAKGVTWWVRRQGTGDPFSVGQGCTMAVLGAAAVCKRPVSEC